MVPDKFSFVCMLIDPLRLIFTSKFFYFFYMLTRRRGLINMETKEEFIGRHFGIRCMNCRRAFQSYKCRNNSITSIAIFHTSSVGLRYSLVFTCFSFFISIELFTKRNRYICVSICLMFQMIDIGSLLMPISRPGARFSKVPKLFGCFSNDIILFVSSKQRRL